MSQLLVGFVGLIYLFVAVDQLMKHNYPMALMWFGYSVAQIGLFIMTK